ncbi:MAG TPA: hypothetical protein VF719_03860, partial [Abditibacteriaceae bacterium]
STPDAYLVIDRKKIASPSPSWSKLLRSTPATGIGSYNEVQTREENVEFSLTGAAVITIPVESRRDRDKLAVDAGDVSAETTKTTDTPTATEVKPAVTISEADDNDLPDIGDDDDAVRRPSRNDLQRLFEKSQFLSDMKTWRRLAEPQQNMPRREPGDRPITPSVTSPTPAPTPNATPSPSPTPAPTILPIDNGKGVGRPALRWVQGSPADFLRGNFERTQVVNDGTIRLSPAVAQIATTSEAFAWSIAGDSRGTVYLGTGNNARILKIDVSGRTTTLYDGEEVGVTALTTDAEGNLYAGLSPGGRVLRFSPDGKYSRIFDSSDTFVWALEWDDNALLIGTGGESGKIFRLRNAASAESVRGENSLVPLASLGQNHVRALAVRGPQIFAGTGGEGVLYRVNSASGEAKALYQADAASTTTKNAQTEILAVVAAPDGVYFGTFGSGTVYRWNETSGVVPVYPSPQQSVFAMRRAADGKIYVATGDKGIVYQLTPAESVSDVRVARLLEPTQLQALSLAIAPASGNLLIGTGNNAAAYRVALGASGEPGLFTSPVFDAKNIVQWGALRALGEADFETRSGNTVEPDESWSAWQTVERNDLGEMRVVSSPARYLQYRAKLGAGKDPNVGISRVEVVYRARNVAPAVALAAPKSGDFVKGKKTFSWTGTDANEDTLRYRLWLSKDGGEWQPVELKNPTTTSFEVDTTKFGDGVYRARVEASDAARNPDEPLRTENISAPFIVDNTAPQIDFSAVRSGDSSELRLEATATDALSPITSAEWRVKPSARTTATPKPAAAPAPTATTSTTTTTTTVTTTTGALATTAPATNSSASTPGTAATPASTTESPLSTPVLVSPTIRADEKDGDDWQAVSAADGIFDSRRERLLAVLNPELLAKATSRQIELRVRDAAGNTTVVTVALP